MSRSLSISHPRPHAQQRGVVLFVALIFLILLTLLALTATSTSILQERMTGGMRNSQLGLMGAESAARGAESWLWNLSNNNGHLNCGYNGGDNGFCYKPQSGGLAADGVTTLMVNNALVNKFRTTASWIALPSAGVKAYAASMTGNAALAQQPQYIIEDMGVVLPPGASANGSGGARDPTRGKGAGNQTLYSYRVTARSTGGNDASVRAVEVYFGAGVPSN